MAAPESVAEHITKLAPLPYVTGGQYTKATPQTGPLYKALFDLHQLFQGRFVREPALHVRPRARRKRTLGVDEDDFAFLNDTPAAAQQGTIKL